MIADYPSTPETESSSDPGGWSDVEEKWSDALGHVVMEGDDGVTSRDAGFSGSRHSASGASKRSAQEVAAQEDELAKRACSERLSSPPHLPPASAGPSEVAGLGRLSARPPPPLHG